MHLINTDLSNSWHKVDMEVHILLILVHSWLEKLKMLKLKPYWYCWFECYLLLKINRWLIKEKACLRKTECKLDLYVLTYTQRLWNMHRTNLDMICQMSRHHLFRSLYKNIDNINDPKLKVSQTRFLRIDFNLLSMTKLICWCSLNLIQRNFRRRVHLVCT